MAYLIYTGSKTELKGRWNGLICYTCTTELKGRWNGLFSLY